MSINDVSKEIPPYFLEKGLDHFSPSQGTMPIDQWVFKYWYSNQKQRRQFKTNSKMNSVYLLVMQLITTLLKVK